ncbi:MAG: O-antigen ligase family protein [Balneolaceae bacterium]
MESVKPKLRDEYYLFSLIAALLTVIFATLIVFLDYKYSFLAFVAVTAGGFFVYSGFRSPWLMLFPIAIGSYMGALFYFFENSPLPVTLFQLFLVAGFSLLILHSLSSKNFDIKLSGLELPVLLTLSLIFVSLIYSPSQESGFFNAIRFLILMVFVLYVINVIQSHRQSLYILIALVTVGFFLAAYTMGEYLLNPQIAIDNMLSAGASLTRVSAGGLYHDPNRFAAILFIPSAVSVAVIFSSLNWKYRLAAIFVFVVLLGGVVSTLSRSGLISIAVIILIIITLSKKWKFAVILGASALAVVLVVPALREALFTTIVRIYEVAFGSTDASAGIRVMLAVAGLSMFFDTYMIGIGFGGFPERFTDYYTLQQSIGVNMPHNVTYKIMAELGLLGLLLFLYLIVKVCRAGYTAWKKAVSESEKILYSALFSSLFAYMIFYQFYGGALTDSNLMLVIGMIFAGDKLYFGNKGSA